MARDWGYEMKYTVEIDKALVPVDVQRMSTGQYRLQIGESEARIVDAQVSGDLVHILSGPKSYSVVLGQRGQSHQAHVNGAISQLAVLDSRTARRRAQERAGGSATGAATVRSPMPGRIVSILVSEGERVSQGQGVIIVEAMKMENELRAEISGTATKIHVKADDRVDGGAILISIEPEGGAEDE